MWPATRCHGKGRPRGTIGPVVWLWVLVIVVLIGALAVLLVGSGDSMAEVYDDRPDRTVPIGRPLHSDDLLDVRFSTAVRGYRMDEVDRVLDRAAAELDARDLEIARLRGQLDGSSGATVVGFPASDTAADTGSDAATDATTDATTSAGTRGATAAATPAATAGDAAMATGSTALTARDA